MADIAKELRRLASTQIEDDLRYIKAADALMVEAADALDAKDERIAELSVGWQPIETAPKDGTVILLGHEFAAFDGYWSDAEDGWIDGDTNMFGDLVTYRPTHWQPLPAPPSSPEGEANG